MKRCNCVCLPVCDCPEGSVECKEALKLIKGNSSFSDLLNMKAHEEKVITNSPYRETKILRVFGGWIYSFEIKEQRHFSHVFVPEHLWVRL